MDNKEIPNIENAVKRSTWGLANVVCKTHENLIRDLQNKEWNIRLIWRHLCENHGVNITYDSFRSAVARKNKKINFIDQGSCKNIEQTCEDQNVSSEEQVKNHAKWGEANVECYENREEIQDLRRKQWPLKIIWRRLYNRRAISVKYCAFRGAVLRLDRKDTLGNATEERKDDYVSTVRVEITVPTKKEETSTPVKGSDNNKSEPRSFTAGIKKFGRTNI